MNNNSIDEVWSRILNHSSDTGIKPFDHNKLFYTVVRHIEFWLEIQANRNGDVIAVLPHNENNSILYPITKNMLGADIIMREKSSDTALRATDFGQPAPSYRNALIHDNRIWL